MLRALGLGDLLTGVPALRALRQALPEHVLVLAAPPALEPLVALAGVADRVHPASGLAPLGVTGPVDVAVNLHGRGPQSHQLLLGVHPQRLVAFGRPDLDLPGPGWVAEEHETERWCRLVGEVLGVRGDPMDLRLAVPSEPAAVPDAVLVHPGAAFPARRWPPERFAEVARWAVSHGWPVLVTGSAGERPLAELVRRAAGLPPDSVRAGETGLRELAAEVAAARLVVCGDTGVAHLATAFGTPSVVLFGPTPPARWGPPGSGPHAVVWHGTGSGDPWGDTVDPALLRVSVPEVLDRAEAMVRRTPAPV